MSLYWIDAVVLIQAANAYYPFHRVPKFWSFLSRQVDLGTIKAPKIVWQEVSEGTDELAQWVKQRREGGLCVSASKAVQERVGEVTAHVFDGNKPHQASEFLRGGDVWVIAHAMDSDGIVVTQESDRSKKAKVKIPTVCRALNVKCIDTFKMLEELKAGRF